MSFQSCFPPFHILAGRELFFVLEGFWYVFLCCVGVDVMGCGAVVPTSAVSSKSHTVALLFVMSLEELQSNLRGFAVLSQM